MSTNPNKCVMAIVKSPAWVALTWLGMTAGISLLAMAGSISTTIRSTQITPDIEFSVLVALNKCEFVALIALLILVRISTHARDFLLPTILVTLVLIAQATWLLPALESHPDASMSGSTIGAASVNSIYSFLELIKLFLLAYLGFRSLQFLTVTSQTKE